MGFGGTFEGPDGVFTPAHFRDGEISEAGTRRRQQHKATEKEASELNGIAQVCLVQELVPSK